MNAVTPHATEHSRGSASSPIPRALLAAAFTAGLALTAAPSAVASDYIILKAGAGFATWQDVANDATTGATQSATLSSDSGDGTAIVAALGWGYDWRRHDFPFRTELELSYRDGLDFSENPAYVGLTSSAALDVTTTAAMLYVFYELPVDLLTKPYVGAGVGWARNEVEGNIVASGTTTSAGKTTDSLAWSIAAGIDYYMTPEWHIDLGYRYANLGEAEAGLTTGARLTGDVTTHEVVLGVRYQF